MPHAKGGSLGTTCSIASPAASRDGHGGRGPSIVARTWSHDMRRLVRQTEAAECGLACLATVAGHFGPNIDLASFASPLSHFAARRDLEDAD